MRAKLVKEDIYDHIQNYGMGRVNPPQNDEDKLELEIVRDSIQRLQQAISDEMTYQNRQSSLFRDYGSADRYRRELRDLQNRENELLKSIKGSKENNDS